MKTNILIIICMCMALFVGVLVGVCVGRTLTPYTIQTGETYEYYEYKQDDMTINPYQEV